MLTDREAVRMTLMRGTVHLVTVRDAALLRPLVQAAGQRGHRGVYGRRTAGVDTAALVVAVRELLADGPLPARELARRLVERGIGHDLEAVADATRVHVPMVQVPPRGVWGAGGQARYVTFESWTGRELDGEPSIDAVVRRYLAAFGPASVLDVQNWSGLTRVDRVVARLRGELVTFRDDRGRELFDVPDAPRPDADVPAPVRLLGEYDNALLGHADRRRVIAPEFPWTAMLAHGRSVNGLLVDGTLRATWWIERDGRRRARLGVRPWGALTTEERTEVEDEARRMLDFAAADVPDRDVRFEAPVV